MSNNLLTKILLTIIFISSLASVWHCYLFTRDSIKLMELQQQVAFAQSHNAFIAALVKDVVDYSSKNSAVDPILEAAGIQPPKAAPVAGPNKIGAK
jgi:hypothetical protein